ncbi:MAG: dockerin type I domain-containing protein [Rubripirellula sp.]|nr:dockerin type I domain-containing protein [Rubripirellula sp.]
MTLRDPSVRNVIKKGDRNSIGRLRNKRRRKDRRLLSETLEQRQLLAGPDLVGIQQSEGSLLRGGEVLNTSPRELIFRFDDNSDLDPLTLASGINITRAGDNRSFESASSITDFGTDGSVLAEFRSAESGVRGNGIEVRLRSEDRGTGSQAVIVSVDDARRIVTLDLNNNPNRPSVVRDLITAVASSPAASALIEVDQISGPSLAPIGPSVGSGVDVLLDGANAALAVSDLGTNSALRARFTATVSGQTGVGTSISVSRADLGLVPGQLPFVTVSGNSIQVVLDSTAGQESTAGDLIAALNNNADSSRLLTARLEAGSESTPLLDTQFSPLVLTGATDTVVNPGYVGLGDTPHEVVFRFAETLPQDTYQIEIFGSGPLALQNLEGESFNDGVDFGTKFSLDNAPQIAAVVPAPVRRDSNGSLSPELNVIEVYLNEQVSNAEDPALYELVFTRDTVSNIDDVGFHPERVTFDSVTRIARLEFANAMSRLQDPDNPGEFLTGSARLRIGSDRAMPSAPQAIDLTQEPGDSFVTAVDSGTDPNQPGNAITFTDAINGVAGEIKSLTVNATIENPTVYGLDFPGGDEMPGVRSIRPDDPSRRDRTVPLDVWRVDGDQEDGISTIFYDFKASWRGDDPNRGLSFQPDLDQTYFNLITDEQKQRAREVLSLYSEYLGVQFVETDGVPLDDAGQPLTENRFISIAVGEIYGAGTLPIENSAVGGVTVVTRPLDDFGNTYLHDQEFLDTGNELLVMDFQDFDESIDDQTGGEFFRGAMLGIGQLLGYGYADHLPQPVTQATVSVLNPGDDNEPAFPSPSDIVNGLYLLRPESNDVDLYEFSLERSGSINIQTVAERLRSASSLDTALRLYQDIGDGKFQEIAANDDYFSNDSLIELELSAGRYVVGVSASGNTVYDPVISGSGIGGRTEGDYELRITFDADGERSIVDQSQIALDGDADGEAGGEFNFWFIPSDPIHTVYVDKAYTGARSGQLGMATNPFANIDDAIANAEQQIDDQVGDLVKKQVRIVGGGTYQIGLDNRALPLSDGATLDLPRGVQLVVDAGSTFLMRRSRIGIGSTTEASQTDRSETSIQVLGTPGNTVAFTSQSASPEAGDWGGIDIRGDIDNRDDSRVNLEEAGVFLNHIQYADIQFGGGSVAVDGPQVVVSPIELASTRPTIINSRISNSADAAIAATPDSLAETRFDEQRFQAAAPFTPDVKRVGPHIRGNEIVDNSINGLFIRIETRTGDNLEQLNVSARIDDTDIVHVLTENLAIEGNPGGPNASIDAPGATLIRSTATGVAGSVPAGLYRYRMTFVDANGYETAASEESVIVGASASGSIRLTGLPTVPAGQDLAGRRLYRAALDNNGDSGPYLQVARLNTNDVTFVDTAEAGTIPIVPNNVQIGRLDPSLVIDPGSVVKLRGSRIDVTFGGHLYAEGTELKPIVFTSLDDARYGAGGSFDTSSTVEQGTEVGPGDWGGVHIAYGAAASFDRVTLAGGGGSTRIEGGFGAFNVIEALQADLRIANSRLEINGDGRNFVNDPDDVRSDRVGRGDNTSGTIFVRASQPVVLNNEFVDNTGPVLTFDVNSFIADEVIDAGRNTGMLGRVSDLNGNSGPMISGNRIGTTRLNTVDPNDPTNRNFISNDALLQNPVVDQNGDPIFASINGLEVRGGKVATELVMDDVDIVHVVRDTIEIPNQHVLGGLRLQSDARGSLVMKFQNQDGDDPDTLNRRQAGIVAGGTLVTSEDEYIDIDDRIGGSLQIVGHPDFPVVLTALSDDTVGAGFTPNGEANVDTDNNGLPIGPDGLPIRNLTSDTSTAVTSPGIWDGITIREAASDANIAITSETEPANLGNVLVNDTNPIPSQSQFLGELAPDQSSGDNNRRLGFIVDGTIAEPSDLDVYSFIGEAGVEIWLDIDRTNSRLDTVIELIDANGFVRVLSDDSLSEAKGDTDRLIGEGGFNPTAARALNPDVIAPGSPDADFQDDYSTNPRDAGMRLVLPGSIGQRFLYHVRVRSANSDVSGDNSLIDASQLRGGLTNGAYQMQIRLGETDVFAGTQVRFSDVRFAVNGVQVIGGPTHSPIAADEFEKLAPNETLADAQRLGLYETQFDASTPTGANPLLFPRPTGADLVLDNPASPLASDRLAKSVGGILDGSTDVDWYQFTINYEQLTRDAAQLYLSTIFDLDYADGVARADTAIYVFNQARQLVLWGTDSNIADDQPPAATNSQDLVGVSDLSRGSFGTNDPFIGSAELNEGTYFIAISNQDSVPEQLGQFFDADSSNPLLRVEPLDSIDRIAEDRIGFSGGGTASDPELPILFGNDAVVPYSLDDVMLYVNTGTRLHVVNPFTGERYVPGGLGSFVGTDDNVIRDVAFRANGELFGYTDNGPQIGDDSSEYVRINTFETPGTDEVNLNTVGVMEIDTFHLQNVAPDNDQLDQESDDGVQVEGISISELFGEERGFFVGNRPIDRLGLSYFENILYRFDDATGAVDGPSYDRARFNPGAGTSPREVGQIDTEFVLNSRATQLGITNATEVNSNGIATPSLVDGDRFVLTDVTNAVTFEFDQGFTLVANGNQPVRDGDTVTIDGVLFEFNTGQSLQLSPVTPAGFLNEGTTVTVSGTDNVPVVFEFVRFGAPQGDNIPISLVNPVGTTRNIDAIAQDLASEITANVEGITSQSLGAEVFFDAAPLSLAVNGTGVTIEGSEGKNNPSAIEVRVSESTSSQSLISALAEVIRRETDIPVSDAGTQIAFPTAVSLDVDSRALTQTGEPGVDGDNIAILLLPTDTVETIGERISLAVNQASDEGKLNNVSATPNGRSLAIGNGFILNATGNLTAGGIQLGGQITGIEVVNDTMFAVSDRGELYRVGAGALLTNGNREIGTYVDTATDLVGINFEGLRAGPVSLQNGALSQLLFGITGFGDILAFNTRGELQPVFAGGRSRISTGLFGARGLDFSVVDFNMWHATGTRGDDLGHGIDPLFNNARLPFDGGTSLAFTYEDGAFGRLYPDPVERPTAEARLDGGGFERTFNVPGGTKGVIQSNSFSLEGYASDDLPMLYFNYFMETSAVDGQDALRVYVTTSEGVEHLVATNNLALESLVGDDEFDDPNPFIFPAYADAEDPFEPDDIDVDVQQLYDTNGSVNSTWRQARVPLGEFAGKSGLSLRVEFSTQGTTATTSESLRVISGAALAKSDDLQFVIDGETFVVDLAPTISFPSGQVLAELYTDPSEVAIVTIDGQDYVLDDGNRTVTAPQIAIDLLAANPGFALDELTANQIAETVSLEIQGNLPPNPEFNGFDFSDPSDDPNVARGRNDLIFEATPLPYTGGNLTIIGSGRFGTVSDPAAPPTNIDDVDLQRLEVKAGAVIEVDLQLNSNPGLTSVVRFFDGNGDVLPSITNPATNTVQLTTANDGVIYIGFSGRGNDSYDPRIPGSAEPGQVDTYQASVSITLQSAIRSDENLVEFFGAELDVAASPANLFAVTPSTGGGSDNRVSVSRFLTTSEVAFQVRRALANRFTRGDTAAIPIAGSTVRVAGFSIDDSGPFGSEDDRFQFSAGFLDAARDNDFEGVYLDDFIIGFAERGEVVTSANPIDPNANFIADGTNNFTLPVSPTQPTTSGAYQFEIRDGSEYVNSGLVTRGLGDAPAQFRTFDTNDRLTAGVTLQALPASGLLDGASFSIFDSFNQVNFEFDVADPEGNFNGLTDPNAVVIELTAEATANEVADAVINTLNSSSVQSVLDVNATRGNTTVTPASNEARDFLDSTINLYGDISFNEISPSFGEVTTFGLRGDANRDRDEQGIILIENSRFLFNQENGVTITRDATANVLSSDAQDAFPSALTYPRNLIELNTEGLIPGVVVQNNVLAFNTLAGVAIEGINGGGGALNNPVGYDQIVNNTLVGGLAEPGPDLGPQVFSGTLYERGGISFADQVVSVDLGGDVDGIFTNPLAALSSPDGFGQGPEPTDGTFTLSLGTGGEATFLFTDNFLTGNDSPAADLVIYETGASETVRVEVSRNGEDFFFVGNANGFDGMIDLDQFGFGSRERFSFVRLIDVVTPADEPTAAFGAAGADIDAIGALSTTPATQFTPGGDGIVVTQNSGPTLLNNVVANFATGVNVSLSTPGDVSRDRTVIGGTGYFNNAANANGTDDASLGLAAQIIDASEEIFVDASGLVFTPQHGATTIDSSIDSLQDRASLLTLRGAVGLPPVPIIAPSIDLNGQLRVDDPNVDTPPGVGARVFKDRGAEDRADTIGPRLSLIKPRGDDLLIDSGRVSTTGTVYNSFEIQLIDGITPADPSSGVGVDDGSVNGSLILLTRLQAGSNVTETLIEGVDYRFSYEPADNIIRLTPLAGIWLDNSVYTIEFLGNETGILQGQPGTSYLDGALTEISLPTSNPEVVNRNLTEVDTGIGISISEEALSFDFFGFQFPNIEGQKLEVFDGHAAESTVFHVTTDNANIDTILQAGEVPVRVGESATAEQIASAVAEQINLSSVKLFATAVGNRIQLRDSVVKASELFAVQGATAYFGADVIPSEELTGASIVGQSLAVFDGTSEQTFTLVTDLAQPVLGTPVLVSEAARLSEISDALATTINDSGLLVNASVNGDRLELRGQLERADAKTSLAFARSVSLNGNPLNDAFKITDFSLDVELADTVAPFADGETVTIFDGTTEQTFEFDVDGAVNAGNVAVPVPFFASPQILLAALTTEVNNSGLQVQLVASSRSFRITGLANPIGVTSATNSVIVDGFGRIGTSPGFGLSIPADGADLSPAVEDGQSFTISRGPTSVTFELDFDGVQDVPGSTLIPIFDGSLDGVANAVANSINQSQLGLVAQNVGGGDVTLTGLDTSNVSIDLRDTALTQVGLAGQSTPIPVVVPLDGSPSQIAEAFSEALAKLDVNQTLVGDRVLIEGAELIRGTSIVEDRISDEVGNQALFGELVIFIGGGYDYGDAPSPYTSTAGENGPRHLVDHDFALWRPDASNPNDRPITEDENARLPDADEDNGVELVGTLQPGFFSNFEISVFNQDGRPFSVDAWFDWNGNGVFGDLTNEVRRFSSLASFSDPDPIDPNDPAGPERNVNVVSIRVPAAAATGEIFARFRLSEEGNLGPNGDADSGEVEDIKLVVGNNPFQNPNNRWDVNASNAVTPLDALLIINSIDRNGGNIELDSSSIPADLPPFPDVNGDSRVTPRDALNVINRLGDIFAAGEGEMVGMSSGSSFMPLAGGVMASDSTYLGDLLIAESQSADLDDDSISTSQDTVSEVESSAEAVSVFDSAPVVAVDSLVDSLAEDTASIREEGENNALDQMFADF